MSSTSRKSAVAMIVAILVAVIVALLLVGNSDSAVSKKPQVSIKTLTSEAIVATWTCQDQLGKPRTHARSPWKPHNSSFRRKQLNLWRLNHKACLVKLHRRAEVNRAIQRRQLSVLTTAEVYEAAAAEIRHGGIYGIAWGAASPLLQALCYEAVTRQFGSKAQWARFIVNRESGCNPRATNTKYSSWRQQAKCIAQLIPAYHGWVDYDKCQRDLRYSVWVFWRLSRGGSSTGPWGLGSI